MKNRLVEYVIGFGDGMIGCIPFTESKNYEGHETRLKGELGGLLAGIVLIAVTASATSIYVSASSLERQILHEKLENIYREIIK